MSASISPAARALRLVISTVVFGALLFLAAGTLAWPAAWGYLAVITAVMAGTVRKVLDKGQEGVSNKQSREIRNPARNSKQCSNFQNLNETGKPKG